MGSPIDGAISSGVRTKKVLALPAGSPVKGRLRRLERSSEPVPNFIVGIEYTEVAAQGIRYRFDASLLRIDSPGTEQSLSIYQTFGPGFPGVEHKTATVETVTFSALPGVATFFIRGDRLNLPPNLMTTWVSRQRPHKIPE